MTRKEILSISKPILFNTDMVRAILDGRKMATRRAVKSKSSKACGFYVTFDSNHNFMEVYDYDENEAMFESPQARLHIGDYLYARETWTKGCIVGNTECHYVSQGIRSEIIFKEDCERNDIEFYNVAWRPSIHMPKEEARIFLRVTDVRVERLQDIKIKDIVSEGVYEDCRDCLENYGYGNQCCVGEDDECNLYDDAVTHFEDVWNSTVKKSDLDFYGWEANPWVWVIEFERVEVDP